MKKIIFILSAFIIIFSGCKKAANCDSSVYTGEAVKIPINFTGFYTHQINLIKVYRTNTTTPGVVDTFTLDKLLWAYSAHANEENMTDRALNGNTDPYYSYLNNSTLIFDWEIKRDTLSNFVITKSKGSTDDKCHKDDPIVKIDAFSYKHKGKTILKDSVITIHKY